MHVENVTHLEPQGWSFMSEPNDDNPYAAPMVHDFATSGEVTATFVTKPAVLQSAWLLAVLINLPIPIMFGAGVVVGPARFGMLLGTVVVYAVGVWLCLVQSGIMWRLILGSLLTALSQFWPVLHMLVGLIAMGISRAIFFIADQNFTRIPEVISATILTGIGLILPSFVFGLIGIAVFRIQVFGGLWKE